MRVQCLGQVHKLHAGMQLLAAVLGVAAACVHRQVPTYTGSTGGTARSVPPGRKADAAAWGSSWLARPCIPTRLLYIFRVA